MRRVPGAVGTSYRGCRLLYFSLCLRQIETLGLATGQGTKMEALPQVPGDVFRCAM